MMIIAITTISLAMHANKKYINNHNNRKLMLSMSGSVASRLDKSKIQYQLASPSVDSTSQVRRSLQIGKPQIIWPYIESISLWSTNIAIEHL